MTSVAQTVSPEKIFLDALERVIASLAEALIRNGVNYSLAQQTVARAFLRATEKTLKVQGLPVTAARLQVFSGLTRRQAESFLSGADPVDARTDRAWTSKLNQVGALLNAWNFDPRYSLRMIGGPLDLPLSGVHGDPSKTSFESLCREFAPNLDPGALLEELQLLGNVSVDSEKNIVRLVRREYVVSADDVASVEHLSRTIGCLSDTINSNLRSAQSARPLFERAAASDYPINDQDFEQFNELMNKEGQKFLEKIDTWLSERRPAQKGKRAGAGLFVFVEENTHSSGLVTVHPETSDSEPEELDVLKFAPRKKDPQ